MFDCCDKIIEINKQLYVAIGDAEFDQILHGRPEQRVIFKDVECLHGFTNSAMGG
jgi:hypothetical protein